MATIGKLVVSLQANSAKLVSELGKSQKRIKRFASNSIKNLKSITKVFAGLGAILAGGLLLAINKNAEAIDNMTKAAGKLNFPIEDFQRFSFIAAKSNIEMDSFGKGVQKMLKTVGDARAGLTTAADAFDQLNLNADDLAKLNPSQQFEIIAEAMKGVESQSDKVKIAMDIFGRSGADLLNVFAGDVKGIGKEFDSLGITITQRQADMVAAFQDAKASLNTLLGGFARNVTAEVSSALTLVIERVTESIKRMGGMKAAANKFARSIIAGTIGAIQGFSGLISVMQEVLLLTKKVALDYKILNNLAGKIVPFGEDYSTESLDKTAKEIVKLEGQIRKNGTIEQSLTKLLEDLNKEILNVGGKEALKANSHVELFRQNQKKLADESAKTASSLSLLSEVTKSAARSVEAGKVSDQFQQYFEMAQRDLNSGSVFAGDKINVLENLINSSRNNGALTGDLNAMQSMINELKNVSQSSQVTAQSVQQLNQQQKPQSLGSLIINMVTDAGQISGKIFAEPEFLSNLKLFVDRQTNNSARAAAQ